MSNPGCSCADWKPNIEKINSSIFMDYIHGNKAGYTGKLFVYCPWCGKQLATDEAHAEDK